MVRVSLTINNIYIWRVLKMAITAQMVKELRDSTGAGMLDCKKALVELLSLRTVMIKLLLRYIGVIPLANWLTPPIVVISLSYIVPSLTS